MNICLFGLSGDPPTGCGGHVGIVNAVKQMNYFDEIWIIPVYRHMYAGKRNRLVSYEHRFKMCQLAFEKVLTSSSATSCLISSSNDDDDENSNDDDNLIIHQQQQSKTKVIVSDIEKKVWFHVTQNLTDEKDDSNITVGTASLLDYLFFIYNDVDSRPNFTFCLGSDAFFHLMNGKWKDSQRIIQMLQNRLLVLYRKDNTNNNNINNPIIINNDIETDILHNNQNDNNVDNDKLHRIQNYINNQCPGATLLQHCYLDNVSSTSVRQCQNIDLLHTMISLPVLQYMKENHLYQFTNMNNNI